MPDPHCSKCCTVKPPKVEPPPAVPAATWVWLAGALLAVTGCWWLVVWAGATLWG
jgi:hypothetical protein